MTDRFPVTHKELDNYVLKKDFKQGVNSQTVIVTGESGSGTQIIVGTPPSGGGGGGGGSGYWATPVITATQTQPTRVFNTIYQNTSGNPLVVTVSFAMIVGTSDPATLMTGYVSVEALVENATPPTVQVGFCQNNIVRMSRPAGSTSNVEVDAVLTFIVPTTWYYKVGTEQQNDGNAPDLYEWTETELTLTFT